MTCPLWTFICLRICHVLTKYCVYNIVGEGWSYFVFMYFFFVHCRQTAILNIQVHHVNTFPVFLSLSFIFIPPFFMTQTFCLLWNTTQNLFLKNIKEKCGLTADGFGCLCLDSAWKKHNQVMFNLGNDHTRNNFSFLQKHFIIIHIKSLGWFKFWI